MRIGLISDTHGLLRPSALDFLRGSDHILHAGDIVGEGILPALRALAPVSAVRGNNDHGPWAEALPWKVTLQFEGVKVHLIHDLHDVHDLKAEARAEGFGVVVCGHSHRPRVQVRDEVLVVNPGSAGPRRFKLPVSVGELLVEAGRVTPRLVELPA